MRRSRPKRPRKVVHGITQPMGTVLLRTWCGKRTSAIGGRHELSVTKEPAHVTCINCRTQLEAYESAGKSPALEGWHYERRMIR